MAADFAERQRVRGRAEGARSADEVHQLRRAPEQLPGRQGGGYALRQVAAGDSSHWRRHLGTADPPQLLRLLLAVAAGRQRRVRLGDQSLNEGWTTFFSSTRGPQRWMDKASSTLRPDGNKHPVGGAFAPPAFLGQKPSR